MTFKAPQQPPKMSVKLLQILINARLKRLAAAVQLRPWPPRFQSLTANRSLPEFPRGAGFFDHKLTSPGKGRRKAFASTLFSAVLFQDPRRSNKRETDPVITENLVRTRPPSAGVADRGNVEGAKQGKVS